MFQPVNPKQSFPKMEEAIIQFWKEDNTFKKSISNPAGKKKGKEYVFYDGPPFATGLPHYGHLVGGVLKDVVPRYWTMQGYKIERNWGWDCHGLPVENEVEKELKLGSKTEIEAFGIDRFNEACRSVVLRYAEEWKKTVERTGRWVDMENDYKTMNPEYMESIWWVFKSLWDKGFVYEGHKVVPYCPRCATPLSNFETNQGYKDKQDPALTIKFELVNEPGTYLLAWTTTPWTLPSNLALAVGPEITYAKIKDANGEVYIMALNRVAHYYKNPADYQLVSEFLGKEMDGWKYKPLLPYFADKTEPKAFTVTTGNFVTIEDGTGIVHMAPFGEDDMVTLKALNVEAVYPLDAECKFNELVAEFKGMDVYEANPLISKKLKDEKKIVRHETINHSYPFCWRCDTPLIYRPISTWFVNVEKIKDQLQKTNLDINWMPDHIKEGRFGKWLEGARDWAISRNRYWGTPLPVWRCGACRETVCIGSIQELRKKSHQNITDLHKHRIDPVTLPCQNCSQKKTEITFVRHGETDWNVSKRLQSFTDNPLNTKGIKQAEHVTEKLKNEKFDLILVSPRKRAKQTAETINSVLHLPVIIEKDLEERNYGDWEGKTLQEDLGFNEDDIAKFRLITPPKGESLETVAERVEKVFQKYPGKKILVVSHGHVFLAVTHLCTNKPFTDIVGKHAIMGNSYSFTYTSRMRRIPEVLDCWFESGSMPYAQFHYPFKNKKKFEKNFPAEFIAEGLDQTRGWFYTLHVLSNALFGKPAFKNCIVNGIVLAEDGQKMSKRLKNYPDPNYILDSYGADALRFYLMNSPVVKADDMRFSEKGVNDVVRNVILPVWNVYSFFVTYANIDKWQPSATEGALSGAERRLQVSKNKLDNWILSLLNELIQTEIRWMEAYDLQKASNAIYSFVDSLTNWYIRRSRRRFWKSEDDEDKKMAYQTLYKVLIKLSQIIAPFMPFLGEEIYRNLTGEESVHLTSYPKPDKKKTNVKLMEEMFLSKTIVSLGLSARAKKKIKVRQPLALAKIALGDQFDKNVIKDQIETIKEELNVKELVVIKNPGELATVIAKPNAKLLGPKYGKDMQAIIMAAKDGKIERLSNGNIKVLDFELTPEEIEIAYLGKEGFDVETEAGILVALDAVITPELELEGQARDLVRQIQEMRKTANYKVDDRITLALIKAKPELIGKFGDYIKAETLAVSITDDISDPDHFEEFEGMTIKIKR